MHQWKRKTCWWSSQWWIIGGLWSQFLCFSKLLYMSENKNATGQFVSSFFLAWRNCIFWRKYVLVKGASNRKPKWSSQKIEGSSTVHFGFTTSFCFAPMKKCHNSLRRHGRPAWRYLERLSVPTDLHIKQRAVVCEPDIEVLRRFWENLQLLTHRDFQSATTALWW